MFALVPAERGPWSNALNEGPRPWEHSDTYLRRACGVCVRFMCGLRRVGREAPRHDQSRSTSSSASSYRCCASRHCAHFVRVLDSRRVDMTAPGRSCPVGQSARSRRAFVGRVWARRAQGTRSRIPFDRTSLPLGRHAQTAQLLARFAASRARLAAARAAASWSGTASPLAKCISSGVCPRNAECGIRPLCSPT